MTRGPGRIGGSRRRCAVALLTTSQHPRARPGQDQQSCQSRSASPAREQWPSLRPPPSPRPEGGNLFGDVGADRSNRRDCPYRRSELCRAHRRGAHRPRCSLRGHHHLRRGVARNVVGLGRGPTSCVDGPINDRYTGSWVLPEAGTYSPGKVARALAFLRTPSTGPWGDEFFSDPGPHQFPAGVPCRALIASADPRES